MQSVLSSRSRISRGTLSLVRSGALLWFALASNGCKSSTTTTEPAKEKVGEKVDKPAAAIVERSTEATGTEVLLPPGLEKSTVTAAQFPTDKVMTTGLKVDDTSVTVGILHSTTGTMAISETGSVQAEKLAIAQINALGGVLGRQIKVIQEDGASDWPTFAEKARKLLVNDKVAAVMGCWTSASRKAVLPVFEKENGLLYYPTFYEGLEQSKNVFYTGQEATQQILASLDWVKKEKSSKTYYLIGSDYIWPRTSMKIARKHIENVLGGTVVGEEFAPLGNTQFGSIINKIKLKKPDVIFAAVVGGSNVAWFKQLNAAGVTAATQTLLTISVTEDEVLGIGGENLAGFFSSMKYFQSQDNPNNKAFVEAFKKMWGDKSVIGDVTQAGYLGPWIWKAAVEKAGSFDVDKVVAVSPDIEIKFAPEGYVKVHANHHLWSKARIGKAKADGQFEVIHESELIEPNPFPKGYQ
jgi:urea transport system substrate-binding protein